VYRTLDPEKIEQTIVTLNVRIRERFPDSGLNNVCEELINIADESKDRAIGFSKPNKFMRVVVACIILFSVFVLYYSSSHLNVTVKALSWGEIMQIFEASINNLIFIGAALFFLVTFEIRLKRKRALSALYELRALAHVIDMHQLTKDPSKVFTKNMLTKSSPIMRLSSYELIRYLDYCSEMLSLTGKIAAIYAENLKDEVVISAVNEIENLTTGLSRKIWQKIIIINKLQSK